MSNDDGPDEYEEQRRKEKEEQRARQMRIKEKVPGRRTTGKAKAGDIDGKCLSSSSYRFHLCRTSVELTFIIAVLDEIKDEWTVVTDPDVSCN